MPANRIAALRNTLDLAELGYDADLALMDDEHGVEHKDKHCGDSDDDCCLPVHNQFLLPSLTLLLVAFLMPEEYEAIKENNVEVEGLDEALDNLEENIRKHVSKKRVVVMKKDGVEEEHSLDARIATRNYWN